MADEFSYTTQMWKRSQNSYASTIPSEILAIKSAPVGEDVEVHWSIDDETGKILVEIEEEDDAPT